MIKNCSIPIRYEQQQFNDDRFLKLKIYVMHDGINLNSSNFEFDAIESAKDTIKNIPILAFVREIDGENEKDFAGHEMELIFKDDEYKFKYLGRPIGVIPADNNNYHYEVIDDKTYVVVDGYVWKDYANDALDILEQDQVKSQSMEINVDEFSYSDDGVVNILQYKYTGVCLLGDDVPPAMVDARAEVVTSQVFNKNQIKNSIANILFELKTSFEEENTTFNLEGGNEEMEEEKLDTFEAEETPAEDMSSEEEMSKDDETMEEQSQDDQDGDEGGDDTDNDGDGTEDYQLKYQELNTTHESLLEAFKQLDEKYQELLSETEELKNFKASKLREEREIEENEVFDKFSEELTEEEMKPLREKASEYSLEDLEDKLFSLAGRKKVKFSATKKQDRISMGLFQAKNDKEVEKNVWAVQKEKYNPNK